MSDKNGYNKNEYTELKSISTEEIIAFVNFGWGKDDEETITELDNIKVGITLDLTLSIK